MNIDLLNNKYIQKTKSFILSGYKNEIIIISFLLLIKILLQTSIIYNGYKWLSADDYCRTVKSFEWLEKPVIYAGVWLSGHFWVNGFAMIFIKDLFAAATTVNFIFSTITVFYFYKVIEISFEKKTAFFSTLIFCVFPFQVWLSISGLPESIFFCFVIAGIYYFCKWYSGEYKTIYLILSSASFALSNMFRYEGWLFSSVLIFFIIFIFIKKEKLSKDFYKYIFISIISLSTVFFWLILNYIDYKDFFFFAKETNKIYEDYNSTKFLQKFIQYPAFIFYSAPITTILSLKVIWDVVKSFYSKKQKYNGLMVYFAMFNIFELGLLMIQGIFGTGGTNMISRYIIINALLFVPLAIYQIFTFKKSMAVGLLIVTFLVNLIWCYYFPHSFRDDTYETGYLLKTQITKKYVENDDKIYFEELEGYYDVFAIQALSNNPAKFILGNFPSLKTQEKKTKKRKYKLTDEELNILDLKSYFEKNKIAIAVVKSDEYVDKLKKMNFKNEEIGDYKIFYIKNIESTLNDSTLSVFSKNISALKENSDIINFNKTIALKDVIIDNTNFGFNPQTITFEWMAVNKNIIDSIDYENYDFDRYNSIVEIKAVENDSIVYSDTKRIFSDRNIEDLITKNEVRNIIVLKPFALIFYSKRLASYPFESGVYNLSLKVYDSKLKKEMIVYRGNSKYQFKEKISQDSVKAKTQDTIKTRNKEITNISKDSVNYSYNLGNIIAMFPNANLDKLAKKTNLNFYRIITQNGLQVFFSQRYQGDNFLNFVFNYF